MTPPPPRARPECRRVPPAPVRSGAMSPRPPAPRLPAAARRHPRAPDSSTRSPDPSREPRTVGGGSRLSLRVPATGTGPSAPTAEATSAHSAITLGVACRPEIRGRGQGWNRRRVHAAGVRPSTVFCFAFLVIFPHGFFLIVAKHGMNSTIVTVLKGPAHWQSRRCASGPPSTHRTRHRPKRTEAPR